MPPPSLRKTLLRCLWIAALFGFVLRSAPVAAQVAISPGAAEVSLPAGQQGEVALVVTNEGGAAVDLFAVPLPEEGAPDDVGELLFSTEPGAVGDPYSITMTESGRLFVARYGGGDGYTWELTPELDVVGLFESPRVETASFTLGLAWMPPEHAPPGHSEGTLWWTDIAIDPEGGTIYLEHALLLEGSLGGVPTGRTVDIIDTLGPGAGPYETSVAVGLAFDAEAAGGEGLFYYSDSHNADVLAVTVDGTAASGYPVPLTDYDPGGQLPLGNAGLDAVRGLDGGAYFDVPLILKGESTYSRVVVTDRRGRNTGAETPLVGLAPPDGFGSVLRPEGVVRSRLGPSVLYLTLLTGETGDVRKWVVAIRAHPLPPRWLRVAPVAPLSLALASGEADTVTVRLNAEGLGPGVYEGQVALRDGGPNGEEAASVPVTLTVTPSTASEEGPGTTEASLSVYPNPATVSATVALSLKAASEVRVSVYDVLGREVAVLHGGRLTAGAHTLRFDGAGLPAGLYLVRIEGTDEVAMRWIMLLR